MLDEGVESRSDGVHRIHWKRIDYKPYENFNILPSPHPGYLTHYFVVNCEFDLCLGMSNVNFTFFYVVIVWLTT